VTYSDFFRLAGAKNPGQREPTGARGGGGSIKACCPHQGCGLRPRTNSDPAWASHLTESVEIIDYCKMFESNITYLSTFLHFSGLEDGRSAAFIDCKQLKVAEGHFAGTAEFTGSGVTKIGDLIVCHHAARAWDLGGK